MRDWNATCATSLFGGGGGTTKCKSGGFKMSRYYTHYHKWRRRWNQLGLLVLQHRHNRLWFSPSSILSLSRSLSFSLPLSIPTLSAGLVQTNTNVCVRAYTLWCWSLLNAIKRSARPPRVFKADIMWEHGTICGETFFTKQHFYLFTQCSQLTWCLIRDQHPVALCETPLRYKKDHCQVIVMTRCLVMQWLQRLCGNIQTLVCDLKSLSSKANLQDKVGGKITYSKEILIWLKRCVLTLVSVIVTYW